MSYHAKESGSIPTVVHLVIEGDPELRRPEVRRLLLREVRRLGAEVGSALRWDDSMEWTNGLDVLRATCVSSGGELKSLGDRAVSELSQAAGRVSNARDRTVRVENFGVALAVVDPARPTVERYGWYRVTLLVEAPALQDEPEVAPYIADLLSQFKRFRNASFAWNRGDATALFTIETVAQSAYAAEAEARNGLGNLFSAATAESWRHTSRTMRLEFLDDEPTDHSSAKNQ
jgi:hypothetical protein